MFQFVSYVSDRILTKLLENNYIKEFKEMVLAE